MEGWCCGIPAGVGGGDAATEVAVGATSSVGTPHLTWIVADCAALGGITRA